MTKDLALDEMYKQFEGMKIPHDIKPLPKLTKDDLYIEVNKVRKEHNLPPVDKFKSVFISLNTKEFRPTEIHIHTADIGSTYYPDFDFSDLDEFDAWRKTCKLKFNLQRFTDVDFVRCDYFLHKAQICEALTLFEEIHRMLRNEENHKGEFHFRVFNMYKYIQLMAKIPPNDFTNLYKSEKALFSYSDSTGVYFNRTIWTFERLHQYLKMANFSEVKKVGESDTVLRVMAKK